MQPEHVDDTPNGMGSEINDVLSDGGSEDDTARPVPITMSPPRIEEISESGEVQAEGELSTPSHEEARIYGTSPQPAAGDARDTSHTQHVEEENREISLNVQIQQRTPPSPPPTNTVIETPTRTIAPIRSLRTRRPGYNPHDFYNNFGLRRNQANLAGITKTSPSNYLNTIQGRPYTIIEPRTYEEAIYGLHAREWKAATVREIIALISKGTWKLAQLPRGRAPVTCKWVFKVKYNSDGTVNKFKARLVARGFSQIENIDFHETFAPTLRFESLRLFFANAVKHDMLVEQMDVDNAYLNSDLEEEIYMTVPPGYPKEVPEGVVLRLEKGLYGLKQAARKWNEKFINAMRRMGFIPITADGCILIRVSSEGMTIICLYVDDILIGAVLQSIIDATKKAIHKEFKSTEAGPVNRILGIQVHRDWKKKTLILEQSQYAERLLKDYSMHEATPVSTPIDGYTSITTSQPDEQRADQREYQKRIGSLMFLMTATRPDLAFVIGKLSQHCCDPTIRHMNAVNRVLRYVRGTTYLGLRYQRTGIPTAFSDAAYTDDTEDRRSTYGYSLLCAQAACIWYSRKQRSVATSTTKAEYVALSEAGKQVVWATRWLQGLKFRGYDDGPITLFGDNKGSNALTRNPEHHHRTKHIDIQFHYIRQLVEDKAVDIEYIPTARMAADILTKPLKRQDYERCKQLLGMHDFSANSMPRDPS